MNSKRLTSSLVALALVSVVALGYAQWARHAALQSRLGAAPTARSASLVSDPCAQASNPCACAAEHGAELLAACFPERALSLVSRAPESCSLPALSGVQAEALAATEHAPQARALATRTLQSDPNNRFARRALAISAIQDRDFGSSDAALAKLLSEDEKDLDSRYYLALSERRRDHYNAAREGFLAVLKVNAQHIDARVNLVTLTSAAGAVEEANHHYQELLQIAPLGDPRLSIARAAVREPSANGSGPTELPVLQRAASVPSVAPSR
jgi:cytochrome c-type biogenesis protein CcmH/NrfG